MSRPAIAVLGLLLPAYFSLWAQKDTSSANKEKLPAGWFSLGGRSTFSLFGHDGGGLGTGGQFRVQLGHRVNTEWFADYILVPYGDYARSEYVHIGWSVMFYPFKNLFWPHSRWQPFVLAGHCFDYNVKTFMTEPHLRKSRWGAAVQAGGGIHFHLSARFDLTVESQYMIHLTPEILPVIQNGQPQFENHSHAGLEGHWLNTLSLNYKIARLWKSKAAR